MSQTSDARPLLGRRAVVCGSSRGIGRAAAESLADAGSSVVLVARDSESLQRVQDRLDRSVGQTHGHVAADFQDPAAAQGAVAAFLAGTGPAEILVNNTGGPPAGPLLDADVEDFERAMRSHLLMSHLMVRACLPGMRARGYGRIINVTSTSVRTPIPGLGVSNIVRAAVANWVKTLAHELGPESITVNNVLPGFTDTDRLRSLVAKRAEREGRSETDVASAWQASVPLRRFADPEEVGAAIVFLASPAASYITGVDLPVDGGRLAAQ